MLIWFPKSLKYSNSSDHSQYFYNNELSYYSVANELTHGIIEVYVDVFLYLNTHVDKFFELVPWDCLLQAVKFNLKYRE
jgi:hypothetical protein